jgi:histidine triad (HIT) family protein
MAPSAKAIPPAIEPGPQIRHAIAEITIEGAVMAYDSNNIFAKIIRGDAPCVKVYEDADTLAFMDVMPQADGHVLVVPKREQAEGILDLSPDGAASLIKTTQKIAKAVKKGMNAPGVMIAQLNGAAAGQTVFHIHFHIIPRAQGAEFRLHARQMEDMNKLKGFAERIKSALE